MSLPALIPLHHDPAYPVAPRPGGGEPPIFSPLPDTDIGIVYRGDTIILPPWIAYDYYGDVIDLTDATVWFTAKVDLELEDEDEGVIQAGTSIGGVEIILPPEEGRYQVRIDPGETDELVDDTVFIFDCQVRTRSADPGGARTLTVRRGLMTVIRDVTRAQS